MTCELRDLRSLPKGHLHLHLEGAMRLETLRELCVKNGVDMPSIPEPSSDGTYESFAVFKDLYLAAVETLRSPQDLQRLVREVVEDASRDGVTWLELHFYAAFDAYRAHLGTPEFVWEVVRKEAAKAGQQLGVGVGFIAGAERWLPPPDSVVTAKLVTQLMKQHTAADGAPLAPIVAFGLQGPEEGFPPEHFEEAFTIARAAGLCSVPHAGEHCGPESVRGALDTLGARRLAHGVRAIEDEALVARLAVEHVCCDTCPTSNVMLRVVPSMASHPLPLLVAAGVPCTVNADDPLLFRGVGLLHEYEMLRAQLHMTDAQLAHLARTSFSCSSCTDTTVVQRGVAGVDAWLAAEA